MIIEELKDKALQLNELDKIRFVEILMDSLDRPSPEVEELWIKESEERYKAYKAGKIKGIPFEKIQEKYFK